LYNNTDRRKRLTTGFISLDTMNSTNNKFYRPFSSSLELMNSVYDNQQPERKAVASINFLLFEKNKKKYFMVVVILLDANILLPNS